MGGSMHFHRVQISGEFKVEDLASGSEEDDYICTTSTVATGAPQVCVDAGRM